MKMKKPLVEKIKACLDQLGKEKRTKILIDFCNYPFVNGDFDFPRLYNMCMSKLEPKNPVQEPPRLIDEEETPVLVDETMKILEKLGEEKATMILNECINLKGHEIDFQLLQKKAMEELAAIKGKKPISEPGIHHEKADKEKLLHGAIEIGKKRARYDEDDDYEPQEKAIMKNSIVVRGYDFPEALKRIMARENGSKPVLVIQKQLSQTDVNPHNARLSLPLTQVDSSFLSQRQRAKLFEELPEGDKKPRIEANLLEPNGNISNIFLARWNMKGGAILNLVTTWKDVVKRNCLTEGMHVQLWSFQAGSQFWLALFTI